MDWLENDMIHKIIPLIKKVGLIKIIYAAMIHRRINI